jgi:hypothetical protein
MWIQLMFFFRLVILNVCNHPNGTAAGAAMAELETRYVSSLRYVSFIYFFYTIQLILSFFGL